VIGLLTIMPTWMARAACADAAVDPELFFPGIGGSTAHALAICRRCPVRLECRNYANTNGERHGIWGGVGTRTEYQRNQRAAS
jgi:WhiB family redox-sensing transcriptional regulator